MMKLKESELRSMINYIDSNKDSLKNIHTVIFPVMRDDIIVKVINEKDSFPIIENDFKEFEVDLDVS